MEAHGWKTKQGVTVGQHPTITRLVKGVSLPDPTFMLHSHLGCANSPEFPSIIRGNWKLSLKQL